MRCSLRPGVGLRVGPPVDRGVAYVAVRWAADSRRGHQGTAIRRRRTALQQCDAGSSPVRWACTTRPAARSGLSAQGRAVGAPPDIHGSPASCCVVPVIRIRRMVAASRCRPDQVTTYSGSSALLITNVRLIAVDLAKRSSSFSGVPLPNTVQGERFGIGRRLSSRFERHETEALRRR